MCFGFREGPPSDLTRGSLALLHLTVGKFVIGERFILTESLPCLLAAHATREHVFAERELVQH